MAALTKKAKIKAHPNGANGNGNGNAYSTFKPRIVAIDSLKPHPLNPNTHSDEQIADLATSYLKFGQYKNIVGWRGFILTGEGFWKGMRLAEAKKIAVQDMSHLTETQALAVIALDNELARRGVNDQERLDAIILRVYEEEGEVLARLAAGEQAALDALLAQGNAVEETADVGELTTRADEINEKWNVAFGDTWEIGRHLLFCCDSERDFVKLTNSVRGKLCLTDPPYGINVVKIGGLSRTDGSGKSITIGSVRAPNPYPFRGKKATATVGGGKWVDATPYAPVRGDDKPFDPTWLLAIADNQIIWGGNYFSSKLKDSRCWLVWDKNNTGNFADAELAWTSFTKSVRLYHHTWNGLVRQGNRKVEGERRLHPTQKPATLLSEIIRDFTEEDELIYDPYGGSGSTLIAAHMAHRVCVIAESEPSYCAVTLQRAVNLGLKPKQIESGNHANQAQTRRG